MAPHILALDACPSFWSSKASFHERGRGWLHKAAGPRAEAAISAAVASEDVWRTAAAASRPAASTATAPTPDVDDDDRSPIARLLLSAADAALAVELINAMTAVLPIPSRSRDDVVMAGLIGAAEIEVEEEEEEEEEDPAAEADVAPTIYPPGLKEV